MNDLYRRFKAGETVFVRSNLSGRKFQVRPEYSMGLLLGYSILDVCGKVVSGYYRKMMSSSDLLQWFSELEEVGKEE